MAARRTRRSLRGTPAQHKAAAEAFYARGDAALKLVEDLAPTKSCAWRQQKIFAVTLSLGASVAEAKQAGVPLKVIKRVVLPFSRRIGRVIAPCVTKKSKS
jgi:hypothetical protein